MMNENCMDQEAGDAGAKENKGPLPFEQNAVIIEEKNQLVNPHLPADMNNKSIPDQNAIDEANGILIGPEAAETQVNNQLMVYQNAIDETNNPIDLVQNAMEDINNIPTNEEMMTNQDNDELEFMDLNHPVQSPEVVIPSDCDLLSIISELLDEIPAESSETEISQVIELDQGDEDNTPPAEENEDEMDAEPENDQSDQA